MEVDSEQSIGGGVVHGQLRAIGTNVLERHVAGCCSDDKKQDRESVLFLSEESTDIRIKAGEDDSTLTTMREDTFQDRVDKQVSLEVADTLVCSVLKE